MISVAPSLNHDPEREATELKLYLGDDYRRELLEHSQELLDEEAVAAADADTLYRTSEAYLYNLTAFAMSPTKLPYLRALADIVEPGARILDYGCGIGSDGLMLLEAGYRVEFADFDNPSAAFLRWRLQHRNLDAPVHDLDDAVPTGFDAAYAFDVIEHVIDPWGFLGEMESRASLVMVNLLEFEPHEQELHYELPIRSMLRYASRRSLAHYRIHHDSSHLLVYGPQRVGAGTQLANLGRIAAARGRHAAGRLKRRL